PRTRRGVQVRVRRARSSANRMASRSRSAKVPAGAGGVAPTGRGVWVLMASPAGPGSSGERRSRARAGRAPGRGGLSCDPPPLHGRGRSHRTTELVDVGLGEAPARAPAEVVADAVAAGF